MHIRWRGLELPSIVECEQETLTANYGKFIAEPFERGCGVTVGNSLRRILLSSLMGSAVTQIRIHGAQHEFTTIPGVLEDLTDIVLNVKSLVVKKHNEGTSVITIEKNEAGAIRGSDIQTEANIEVINPDHVIATLTESVSFFMEMVVENNRGYVPASEQVSQDQEVGIIPIDAVYSPVTRVRYHIDETRVGQKKRIMTSSHWKSGPMVPPIRKWRLSKQPRSFASTSIPLSSTRKWGSKSMQLIEQ